MDNEFKIRETNRQRDLDPDATTSRRSGEDSTGDVWRDREPGILSDDRQPGAANATQTGRAPLNTGGGITNRPGTAAAAAVMVRETTIGTDTNSPLFPLEEAADFRSRWDAIQVRFIDEPRRCVEQADALVAESIDRLSQVFTTEREKLEREWDSGGNISTEDLRLALQRYRSFFGRLMQVGV